MKLFRKYLLLLLISMSCLSFLTACGDDDDDKKSKDEALVGVWEITHNKGWEKLNGVLVDEWDEDDNECRLEFKANATFVAKFLEDGEWVDPVAGSWSIDGDILSMTMFFQSNSYKIKTLTSDTLVLEYHNTESGESDVYESYSLETYKRIR